MVKRAVYAGSFDPFHNGHLYIYEQAKEIFDEVIILIANHPHKERYSNIGVTGESISRVIGNSICAILHDGLVADWCKGKGIGYLVRGLRSTSDYLYEEEVAKINSEIYTDLKTVYFRARDNAVSSTLVRLLHEQGQDISKYVPAGVVLTPHSTTPE